MFGRCEGDSERPVIAGALGGRAEEKRKLVDEELEENEV
jgi:hypothetical protein